MLYGKIFYGKNDLKKANPTILRLKKCHFTAKQSFFPQNKSFLWKKNTILWHNE